MLTIDTDAVLSHINPRKEGEEGERLALDLKLTGNVGARVIAAIIGGTEQDILPIFWRTDHERNSRFFCLEYHADSAFEDCQIHIGDARNSEVLTDCRVRKFAFVPRAGATADLTFQVTLPDPSDKLMVAILCYLKQTVRIRVESQQQDLFAPSASDGPTPADYGVAHGCLDAPDLSRWPYGYPYGDYGPVHGCLDAVMPAAPRIAGTPQLSPARALKWARTPR